ncbi:hypothetical protein [Rothia sp. ZJ932]|uniref:hypothetical protein n=1 Tax=Rothia sp. ZJ932 TaxID=2810516 RepID=UPI0019683464|nr:hypothetical protein [Rothia sp. ZJ932]QRZ60827.1 hypothetical protein JR346_05920 [Rothia sp. ZJ932]
MNKTQKNSISLTGLALVLGLVAGCSTPQEPVVAPSSAASSSSTPTPEPTVEPTPEMTEGPAPEPTPEETAPPEPALPSPVIPEGHKVVASQANAVSFAVPGDWAEFHAQQTPDQVQEIVAQLPPEMNLDAQKLQTFFTELDAIAVAPVAGD